MAQPRNLDTSRAHKTHYFSNDYMLHGYGKYRQARDNNRNCNPSFLSPEKWQTDF